MVEPSAPSSEALLQHAAFVRGVAIAALRGDPSLVDDVVQETWVAALESRGPREGKLRAWLGGVARRQAANLLRRRSATRRRETKAARPEAVSGGTEVVERAEIGRRVVRMVMALDEPYRTALLLRYHDDLPPREIATRMGVPVETARTRVKRGLTKLRLKLDEDTQRRGQAWQALLLPLLDSSPSTALTCAPAVLGGGGLAMKKVVLAMAVIMLLTVGGYVFDQHVLHRDHARPEPESGGEIAQAERREAQPQLVGRPEAPEAAPPALPEATRRVHGRVQDESGAPVGGAVVEIRAHFRTSKSSGREYESSRDWGVEAAQAVETGEAGGFAVSIDESSTTSCELRVVYKDYAQAVVRARVGEETVVILRPGGLLEVQVEDLQGRAVPVAQLTVADAAQYSLGAPREKLTSPLARGQVDGAGGHTFALPPGQYRVRVEAVGFAPADSEIANVQLGEDTRLGVVLQAGALIRVRVCGEDESPIAGANVRIGGPMGVVRVLETDASGEGEVQGFPLKPLADRIDQPGHVKYWRWRLWYTVQADGYAFQEGGWGLPAEPGTKQVEVQLVRGTAVRLRVVEPSGAPIPKVSITVVTDNNLENPIRAVPRYVTDANGWAELGNLPSGNRRFLLWRPSERFQSRSVDRLLEGDLHEETLELGLMGGSVLGRVRGPQGDSIVGVRVGICARDADEPTVTGAAHVPADAGGRFELKNVPVGQVVLAVAADAFMVQTFPLTLEPGTVEDLGDVHLQARGRIAGRVLSQDGEGVGGVELHLVSTSTDPTTRAMQMAHWASVRTAPDGAFAVGGVPEGREFTLATWTGEWVPSHPWPRHVKAGHEDVHAVVKPRSEGAGAPVRLRVLSDGEPYEGPLHVQWTDEERGLCGGNEDPRSEATVRVFRVWTKPGMLELTLQAPGYRPARVSVEVRDRASEDTTAVHLNRGASLGIWALDREGRPVATSALLLTARWGGQGHSSHEVRTDSDGRATLTGLVADTSVDVRVELVGDRAFTFANREGVHVPGETQVTLVRRGTLMVKVPLTYSEVDGDIVCRLIDGGGRVAYERRRTRQQLATYRADRGVICWAHALDGQYRLEIQAGSQKWAKDLAVTVGLRKSIELEAR